MIEARIRIQSSDQHSAKSIVGCVEPDNVKMKGLTITSRATTNNALFHIRHTGGIETFISTLDDLLGCVQAANATLGMIKKNQVR